MHNQDGKFIVKALILFGSISLGFSSIGLLFPESPYSFVIGSPLQVSTISVEHVIGHILWGAVIGIAGFKLRYVILGGGFAILLDADHLLQFLDLEMIVRMSHAIPFAIIAAFIFYFVFNRRDLRLSAVAFSAVLSHIAFDTFLVNVLHPGSVGEFPLFAPLLLDTISFQGTDWLIFEIVGFVIVMICSIFFAKKKISKNASVTKT
tara:strand:+ start:111 stop:728 length:618 start_codon:yes stop_codon:yes gene_type:complete